jgi:ATP-dependent helicase/nuclease subunit A
MNERNASGLADEVARKRALDTTRSFLVQAPAGSGKTELLAMRILNLLVEVEQPEQVLAITFARDATAEMRHRILEKLEVARAYLEHGVAPAHEDAAQVEAAIAVLERSNQRGWRLLEQPQRLNIQTIDSLCLRIAHRTPLQARLSGTLEPIEDATPLYREAARKTVDRLGGGDESLDTALKELLSHRDSNLKDLETLLEKMLSTRDQWGHAFPLTGEIDWEQTRHRLERPLHRAIDQVLKPAHSLLFARPDVTNELLELATYACNGEELKSDILALAGLTSLPDSRSPEHWVCIANLLLKKDDDEWLVNADKRHGFPAGKGNASFETRQKDRRKRLINDLQQIPNMLELLSAVRNLPPAQYSSEQWAILQFMFTALRQAAQELKTVFAERGAVDFVEISSAALEVLRETGGQKEAGSRGWDIRHLLVDEFQDTSRRQHELISALIEAWSWVDGRTVFLVGDPMQSIYMFRQADVELFDQVRRHGIQTGSGFLPIETLQLITNFRSTAGIVDPLNRMFEVVFPYEAKSEAAPVAFLPGVAKNPSNSETAYQVHPNFADAKQDGGGNASWADAVSPSTDAQQREVASMMAVIQRHIPAIDEANRTGQHFTVAVLARAKNHLSRLAAALRAAAIPFRAVELEGLGERQEILDLQSLTRALLHPMDRIAWLALMRAPWCGLMLRDLHILCGADENPHPTKTVGEQIQAHMHLLDPDARDRISRVVAVMQGALQRRYSQSSLAGWIERTWHSLGGPDCVDASGYENALTYFRMLDTIALDGIDALGETMDDRLSRLFAQPDPNVSARCGIQLMTIHKAKGLGFSVVLIPGLERRVGGDNATLIRYLERSTEAGTELLVAPIGSKGEDPSPLNKWVHRQEQERESEERKRLLYVACTRARDELHLFGTASITNSGMSPGSDTLLKTAWPSLEETFSSAYAQRSSPVKNVIQFSSPQESEDAFGGILRSIAANSPANRIRRLPPDWHPAANDSIVTEAAIIRLDTDSQDRDGRLRPQASRGSRVLGTTVHALFERISRLLLDGVSEKEVRAKIARFHKQAATLARNEGLSIGEAEACANAAADAVRGALDDACGRWLLGPRFDAQTESSWTGMLNGVPRSLRIDRSFRAGPEALGGGRDYLWIIDYKTATHGESGLADFLGTQRMQYRDQLESYGTLMRLVHGHDLQLRLGLYYPLLKYLDVWVG